MPLIIEDAMSAVHGWHFILLALIFAFAAGALAGLLYRAGSAILLSFICLIAGMVLSGFFGWPFWQSSLMTFGLIAVLQSGYLAGATLGVVVPKMASKTAFRAFVEGLFKRDTAR